MRGRMHAPWLAGLSAAMLLSTGGIDWAASPVLTSLALSSGPPGTVLITLGDSGFGPQAGPVSFTPSGGPTTTGTATTWPGTQVSALVPDVPAGDVNVAVYSPSAGYSNALPFEVNSGGTGRWSVVAGSWAGWTSQAPGGEALYTGITATEVTAQVYQPPDNAAGAYCGGAGLVLTPALGGQDYVAVHQCDSHFVVYGPTNHVLAADGYTVPYVSAEPDSYHATVSGGTLTVSVRNPAGVGSSLSIPWPTSAFRGGAYADAGGRVASFTVGGQTVPIPPAPPAVASVDPAKGPTTGGGAVTIHGVGLAAATAVDFGSTPASGFEIVSDGEIDATAPAGAGTVAVTVLSGAGPSVAAGPDLYGYVPVVTGVAPSSGPALGGSQVILSGAGFSGATAVYFGTRPAAGFTVDSDTEITATAPSGPGGATVNLAVFGPGGSSLLTAADRFTYTLAAPPTITAVQPDAAPDAGGTTVRITGRGFAPDAAVRFGRRPATGVAVSPDGTTITATAPPGAGSEPVTVSNPVGPAGLAATDNTAFARMADGSVLGWGSNSGNVSPLGNAYADTPLQIPGLTDVVQALVGNGYAVALRADGTVWAWGDNSDDQLGQGLSHQQLGGSSLPLQVRGLTSVAAVAAGENFALALRSDGTVWEWGTSYAGLNNTAPTQVPGLSGASAIAASANGATAYVLRRDGTVWAWGHNNDGQVGDGTTTDRAAPVEITGLAGVTAIAAGPFDGYALSSDGTVWAWGAGAGGALGDGGTANSDVPVQVAGLRGVRAIAGGSVSGYCGYGTGFALATDGTVWAWGAVLGGSGNYCDYNLSLRPAKVAGLPGDVAALAAPANNGVAYALASDGSLWAWRLGGNSNTAGELGDGTTAQPASPVQVSLGDVVSVSAGNDAALAIRGDGTVWAWGGRSDDQVLGPVGQASPVPVRVTGLWGATAIGTEENQVSAHGPLSLALKPDGSVWAWGCSNLGCSALPTMASNVPVTSVAGMDPRAGAVIRADGTVWQYSGGGQPFTSPGTEVSLPAGVTAATVATTGSGAGPQPAAIVDGTGHVWWWAGSCAPNEVSGLHDVVALAVANGFPSGTTFFALRSDGTVWTFAWDALGGCSSVSEAAQVSGLQDVRALAVGEDGTAYALDVDGTVWAWGNNAYGALGIGESATQLSRSDAPRRVSGLTDVTAIAAGHDNAYAVKADGTVWAWGNGPCSYGACGAVPGGGSLTPVPVAGFDIAAVTASAPFTYVAPGSPAPTVAAVKPATGPAVGGTTVTVTGSGFTVATAVDFGAVPAASFRVLTDSQLTAVAPPGSGTVDLTVTSAGGTSAKTAADEFTYQSATPTAPVVSGVTPATAGLGTAVTVTGSGFATATAVYFGTVPAASFRVLTDSRLIAIAPPGSGTVDVTVASLAGRSATGTADRFTYRRAGPPASLSFVAQPPAWVALRTPFSAGQALSVALAVYDQAGHLAAGSSDTLALALLPPGGGAAVWTGTQNVAGGLATFDIGTLPVTIARPGSGYRFQATDLTTLHLPTASSRVFDLVFPWPLFASDSALRTPQGNALAVWGDLLPASGQGDDSAERLPWSFAGVDDTFRYSAGEHVLLSGDPLGKSPFCVDGTWTLKVAGASSTSLFGSGCSGHVDMASLGLSAGNYGLQLTLNAPARGTQYGASDVYLLAAAVSNLAEEPLPDAHPPLGLRAAATPIAVGSPASVPVTVTSIPFAIQYLHFAFSYDPAGIRLTDLTPPAGWSGGGSGENGSGQYGAVEGPGASALQLGDTAFTLQLGCLAPGTWDLSFLSSAAVGTLRYLSSIVRGFAQTGDDVRQVSGLLTVTCVPPLSSAARAAGVSVDPQHGTLSVTVTGAGLDQAAKAELLDPSGVAVATSTSFSDQSPTLLTAKFPVTPAGLDTLRLQTATGTALATVGPLAVPAAVPVLTLHKVDALPQVPGFKVTHLWRLSNVGLVDGVALLYFQFPAYMASEPALIAADLPAGSVLVTHGFDSGSGWSEVVAVPVPAGTGVDIPWEMTLPPAAVFGTAPAIAQGAPIPMVGTILAAVSSGEWSTLAGRDPVTLAGASASQQRADLTQALSALNTLGASDPSALQTYFTAIAQAEPALAAQLLNPGALTTVLGEIVAGQLTGGGTGP